MAGTSPEDLDMIVSGTVTPDRQFPSTSCMVQKELNALKAAAFDISAGCSGFLYALSTVDNAVKVGACKKALVIGVERLSGIVNWKDRGTCVLLADGAGAIVVEAVEGEGGILSTHIQSDGTYWDLLYSTDGNNYLPDILNDLDLKPFHLKMEGNRLFKRAVEYMTEIAEKALHENGLSGSDIELVVPHQANIRIIQALAKNLAVPMEKVYTNIHKYGNTSSATIPLALDEANREGLLGKGKNLLFVSFGAGLTWASAIVRWTQKRHVAALHQTIEERSALAN
jgi:3-oxoacyl-[acyl-carrier-protein] synthase-3